MRRSLMAAACLLAAFWFLFAEIAPPSAGQADATEEQVRAVVQGWLDAEGRGDRAALGRLIAGDFVGHAYGGNIVYREDIIPHEEGQARASKMSLKTFSARAFDSTAVAMGRVSVTNESESGEFLFTLVLMKRGEGWQIVAAHLSR